MDSAQELGMFNQIGDKIVGNNKEVDGGSRDQPIVAGDNKSHPTMNGVSKEAQLDGGNREEVVDLDIRNSIKKVVGDNNNNMLVLINGDSNLLELINGDNNNLQSKIAKIIHGEITVVGDDKALNSK